MSDGRETSAETANDRERAQRRLLDKPALGSDRAATEQLALAAGVWSQALSDQRLMRTPDAARRSEVVLALQHRHGNAYVQRLIGGAARPADKKSGDVEAEAPKSTNGQDRQGPAAVSSASPLESQANRERPGLAASTRHARGQGLIERRPLGTPAILRLEEEEPENVTAAPIEQVSRALPVPPPAPPAGPAQPPANNPSQSDTGAPPITPGSPSTNDASQSGPGAPSQPPGSPSTNDGSQTGSGAPAEPPGSPSTNDASQAGNALLPGIPGLPGGGLPALPGLPGGGLPSLPGLPGGGLPSIPGLPGGGLPSIPGLPGGGLPALPGLPGGGAPPQTPKPQGPGGTPGPTPATPAGPGATPKAPGPGGGGGPGAPAPGAAPKTPATGKGGGGGAGGGAGLGKGGGGGPAPAPKTPTPTSPASGVDWSGFLKQFDDPLNLIRTVLEVARPIPYAGLFAGIAADGINTYQDLDNIKDEDAPFTKGAVMLRDGVMIMNNIIGSLSSLDQWIQDIVVSLGVTVEIAAVTAEVQLALKEVKVTLDGVQIGLDVVVAAAAAYNAAHATTAASREHWNNTLTNYEANIIGDGITTVIDVIDLSTAGAANGENVKQAANGVKNVVPLSKTVYEFIRSVLLGWFGVYGGGLPFMPTVPAGGPSPAGGGGGPSSGGGAGGGPGGGGGAGGAPSVQLPAPALPDPDVDITPAMRQTASAIIRAEIAQMKQVYEVGDLALTGGQILLKQMIDEQIERLKIFTEGQDPVRLLVTTISAGIDQLNNEITQLTQMSVLAASAKERSDAIVKFSDEAVASIDALKVPTITVPKEGSGGVLDAAAQLLQEQVVDRAMNQVRSLVDDAKKVAKEPLATVKGSAEDIAEFSVILQKTATGAITNFQERIAKFSAALAKCTSVEDIVNVMINQIFENLGLGEGFTIDEALAAWKSVGPMLDQADDWAAGLASGGGGGGNGGGATPEDHEAPAPQAAAAPPEQ